ncbi:MAG: HAD family phosphatase [Proteobacteria bacterium]|nr:HAD family phosphatase [Pseudomonadota bacterium]
MLAQWLPHHAPDAAAGQALALRFFEGYGGDWSEFDRGTVERDDLASRIARRTGLTRDEALMVIDGVPAALTPIDGTVGLLRRLHDAGHPLYFLSNMPAPYASHLEAVHDFVGLFRAGVFSSRVQMLKPEPQIYAHALDHFGIAAADTIFIDDLERNVDAARAAGWRALHFTSPEACEAELIRLGCLAESPERGSARRAEDFAHGF